MQNIKLKIINILQSMLLKLQPSSREILIWKKSISLHMSIILNLILTSRGRLIARSVARKSFNELLQVKKRPQALIIANGPSSKMLDFNKVVQMQKNNELDVFVINLFYKSKVKKNFSPDYLVLSDPAHKPDSSVDSTGKLWYWATTKKNLKIICPTYWSYHFNNSVFEDLQVYFFNDFEQLLWTKNLNPVKPRSYMSLTILKAIAVASSLGYEQIYLIGADNTLFKGLTGSFNNDIHMYSNHAQKNYHPPINYTKTFGMTSADYFADVSRIFTSFSDFKHLNIVNLDQNSLVDVFSKSMSGEFLKTNTLFEIDKKLGDN